MRQTRSILPALWIVCTAIVIATGLIRPPVLPALDPTIADTYSVAPHSGFAISFAAAFLGFDAFYLLMDWAFRPADRRSLGIIHLGLMFGGWVLIHAPMVLLRLLPQPAAGADFVQAFRFWNGVTSVGYCLILASLVGFLAVVVDAVAQAVRARSGRPAP